MKWVTENANMRCVHSGKVSLSPSQQWVKIEGLCVLVDSDPEQRSISGCANQAQLAGIIPCSLTMPVDSGYSDFIRIDGHRVCLDAVKGKTVGSPPGVHDYLVIQPGQDLVEGDA